jgi:hypothetical protein
MCTTLLLTVLQGEAITTGAFIEKILGSPIGSFSFVLGILLLSGWLIYFVTDRAAKFKYQYSDQKEKMKDLNTCMMDISRDTSYMRGNIDFIMDLVNKKPALKSKSPISLTEYGEELAKEIDAEKRIARNWENITRFLDSNINSRNAYDIQTFCIDQASVNLDRLFNKEDMDEVKMVAFRKGNTLFLYGQVIGVLIRDAYFKYKGIDVLEVDKYDPKNH